MLEFVLNYWLTIGPSFLVGLTLLRVLRQQRAARAARRVVPAPIVIER